MLSQIGKGLHYNQNQGDGRTSGDQGETVIPPPSLHFAKMMPFQTFDDVFLQLLTL